MIVVSKHAAQRFRERICATVEDVTAAILESVEHGAIRVPARVPPDRRTQMSLAAWSELRTRRPFAMRLLMRDETVVTVRWPDGGNKEAARGKRAQRKGARRMMMMEKGGAR